MSGGVRLVKVLAGIVMAGLKLAFLVSRVRSLRKKREAGAPRTRHVARRKKPTNLPRRPRLAESSV